MNEHQQSVAALRFEEETLDILFEAAATAGYNTGVVTSSANGATFISAFSVLSWSIEEGTLSVYLSSLNGFSPEDQLLPEPETYTMVFVDNQWLWRDTTGVHWAIKPKTLAEIWNRKFLDHIQKHETEFWTLNLTNGEWVQKAA